MSYEVTDAVRRLRAGGADILLRERGSYGPLNETEKAVLEATDSRRLNELGLELEPQLGGGCFLKAGNRVGMARVSVGRTYLTIHVLPKIPNVGFLRMVQYTSNLLRHGGGDADAVVEEASPVSLLLRHFSDRVLRFLQEHPYKGFAFQESHGSRLKGKLLVTQYARRLDRLAHPHRVPHRFVDHSVDTLDNQILAYSIHIALRLAAGLPSAETRATKRKLRSAERHLVGVTVRRILPDELARIAYHDRNRHFEAIHALCRLILEGSNVTLGRGRPIPFTAFSMNMPDLFQFYVQAACSAGLGHRHEGRPSHLRYPLDGHVVKLDGLVVNDAARLVLECKYKDREGASVFGLHESDLYQAAAYAALDVIAARGTVLVYPTWKLDGPPCTTVGSIEGFSNQGGPVSIHVIEVNLASPFRMLARGLEQTLLLATRDGV